jgi:hypothetical protein
VELCRLDEDATWFATQAKLVFIQKINRKEASGATAITSYQGVNCQC